MKRYSTFAHRFFLASSALCFLTMVGCQSPGSSGTDVAEVEGYQVTATCNISHQAVQDTVGRFVVELNLEIADRKGGAVSVGTNLDSLSLSLEASVDDSSVADAHLFSASAKVGECNVSGAAMGLSDKEKAGASLNFDLRARNLGSNGCDGNRLTVGGVTVVVIEALPDPLPHHHLRALGLKVWKNGEEIPASLL